MLKSQRLFSKFKTINTKYNGIITFRYIFHKEKNYNNVDLIPFKFSTKYFDLETYVLVFLKYIIKLFTKMS